MTTDENVPPHHAFVPFLMSSSEQSSHTLTVAMSMEAVASSMMRMLLFLTKALARQNSCL